MSNILPTLILRVRLGRTITIQPFSHSCLVLQRALSSSTGSIQTDPAVQNRIDKHKHKVRDISSSVRSFYDRKQKFRIFHGSTNSTRPRLQSHASNIVDTSQLRNVLYVDTERQTALVEPNVSMDRLVEETLKYGLVPPVVMEFPGITVGGGYAGTSGESSSFKHGFFDKTLNYVEMVLADGQVITCSEDEKPDLFHGAAGALGTLGITTLVEIQLRKASRYVETTYHPVSTVREAIELTEQMTHETDIDYVDGILFSPTQGAVVTGRMTDTPPSSTTAIRTFSNPRDPWFYLHVQDQVSRSPGQSITESIPLGEYLFRYDRGGFWVGASAFSYFHFPFSTFTRWWLDDFLHTRMMYTALHASGQSQRYVVQDLALPYDTAEEFIRYTDETFGIWPLWLCPLRQSEYPTMHPHFNQLINDDGKTLKPMLNIGLWGQGPQRYDDFVRLNRDLEAKLTELDGMKWLYAHTYYNEDEFWSMFDRDWYDALRQKYGATTLPSVYDKVRIDVEAQKKAMAESSWTKRLLTTWPLSGFYGIRKAIQSGTYLDARASTWRTRNVETPPK